MSPTLLQIDDTDRRILSMLQANARTANAEIARQVGLTASAVFDRVRKLEEKGVLAGYTARVDAASLGLGLVAFILVRLRDDAHCVSAGDEIAKIPGVQEVHDVAGEDCYLVKVRAADTEALGRLLRERFNALKAVRSTKTTIVLHTVKESAELPIDVLDDERAGERAELDSARV